MVPVAPSSGPMFSSDAQPLGLQTLRSRLQAKDEAERVDMQVDMPVLSDPLASMRAAQEVQSHRIYKMEDYMAQQLEEHNPCEADTGNSLAGKNSNTDEDLAPLKPIAIGARSSKHTILLNNKYQALGISQPIFSYEGASDSGWTVAVLSLIHI